MPSIKISPEVTSYNLDNNLINVLFPEPFSPTKARLSLGLINKLIFSKAGFFALGYLKVTFLNSIPCFMGEGNFFGFLDSKIVDLKFKN